MEPLAMLAAYQKERQGAELEIDPGRGIATWKLLFGEGIPEVPDAPRDVYLVDIYVAPEYRRNGVASALMGRVAERGKAAGATRMIGTVDIRTATRTVATKAILAAGFELDRIEGGAVLVFTRSLANG